MRYAKIDEYELVNGKLAGVSLYTQGCHFRCPNCFNPETWDCDSGKEWTEEVQNKFFEMIDKPFIKRVTILGGDPLHENNLDEVLKLILEIRFKFPNKTIWLYTGYVVDFYEVYNSDHTEIEIFPKDNNTENDLKRLEIISKCDVLVDGKYIDELRNVSLHWRGSSNQKIWKNNNGVWENITNNI